MYHNPVLLKESIDALITNPDGVYVDVTFGGGGHAKAILARLEGGQLFGFDQDSDALANAPQDPRFTFVQANVRSGGKVIPLVQREEDEKFKSVFITSDPAIKALADLKGKDVSFGSQSSTSGHLMPRSFLLAANINPEKDFRRIAYSGAHDATIASVVSGKVDAAALDITVWKKFVAENKVDTKAVDVFFTTPGYFNYNWSVHADMPADQQAKLKAALLALNPANPEHAEILRLNRATRYIATQPENYKGLEAAARSAGLL